jgi:hypothetical protein
VAAPSTAAKSLPMSACAVDNAPMNQLATPVRRFGPEFVEAHRRRYGHRPAQQRQLTYDIAVLEEYAPWRDWLDEQLALLPPHQADKLARRWLLDEHFWPVIFELATGAGLRAAGLRVVYDREYDNGLTPDWTVLSDRGDPLCLVEVHTHSPPKETFGQMRAWHGLVQRIKEIPVSVVLVLASQGRPIRPPTSQLARKIAQDLRLALLRPGHGPAITSYGYAFRVVANPTGGGVMPSPLGLHACFEPPSCIAGVVSARQLAGKVEGKVRKYGGLADALDVPLLVAVGAHPFTGVTLEHLDTLLAGTPTTMFQFNLGDAWIGEETVDLGRPDRWGMPAELAGVLWAHNQPPFGLAWRPNPAAPRSVPAAMRAAFEP